MLDMDKLIANFNLFCLLVNLLTDPRASFDGVSTIVERDATLIALMKIS